MKIGCDVIQDLLPLYCDNVCSEESSAMIAEHLHDCETCREDFRLMKKEIKTASVQAEDEDIVVSAAAAWKKGKRKAFMKGCIAVLLGIAAIIGGCVACHWGSTVDANDLEGLAQQAADYFGYEVLYIEEVEQRGDYLAILCTDARGDWSMCVFDRDRLFENRWRANGGNKTVTGGQIGSWNYGSPNQEAVLIFCGGDLPEEVCWYEFQNSRITYICPVDDHTLLDIFIIPDENDINGAPILLDCDQQAIN